jgi:hypothetical protein
MHGNSGGGGGGAALGYLLATNPEVIVGLAAVAALSFGVYCAAVAIDTPSRAPIVDTMVQHSIEHCLNAKEMESLYKGGLKERLTDIWSKDLKGFEASTKNTPICVDKTLGDYPVAYKRTEVGTEYRGEYRVVGLSYTKPDGSVSYVVRPDGDAGAKHSTDSAPDSAISLKTVLENLQSMPKDTYQHTLADGTKVAAFMQHDGVTQAQGSSVIQDNDGSGWADMPRIAELSAHYSFAWPATGSGPAPGSW